MIRMIEAGLIAKFHSKWWPRVSECNQDSSKSATALQIDSMAGIFIVYAAFTGLALIFFVSELIFYFFIRRQRDTKIKASEDTNLKQPLWWYKFKKWQCRFDVYVFLFLLTIQDMDIKYMHNVFLLHVTVSELRTYE